MKLCTFIGHKWKSIIKKTMTIRGNFAGVWIRPGSYEQDVVGEVQQCQRCGKERGFIHDLDGDKTVIEPLFVKDHY